MSRARFVVVASVMVALVAGCGSREPDERFLPRTYVGTSGETLLYRLFVPEPVDPDSSSPLVVFLHGGRGAGTDNVSQISGTNRSGSHAWIDRGAYVAAPQLPGLNRWDFVGSEGLSSYGELVVELVAELRSALPIDPEQIYLTGQSRGGWGVWDLIAKRPDLFAAAVPVCGGGDPTVVAAARGVAIWAFHGAKDREVSVERTREMVEALRVAGTDIEYTEYRTSGHAIWDRAYSERGLLDWMFAQRKNR